MIVIQRNFKAYAIHFNCPETFNHRSTAHRECLSTGRLNTTKADIIRTLAYQKLIFLYPNIHQLFKRFFLEKPHRN